MWWMAVALAAPTTWPREPSPPHVSRPAPIVGGEATTDFPAAVGLGVLGRTVCSGSLIAPRVVLTAAHCGAKLPADLITTVGEVYATDGGAAYVAAIEAFTPHPSYVPLSAEPGARTLGAFDLAVVLLAEPLPVAPVPLRRAPLSEAEVLGASVVSVGWGDDRDGVNSVKRAATLTIDALTEMFLVSESATNEGRASICHGDSGGPQYHILPDGRLEQWGSHSWVSNNCRDESGATRTDVAADWIAAQVAAAAEDAPAHTADTAQPPRRAVSRSLGVQASGCATADRFGLWGLAALLALRTGGRRARKNPS